MRDFKEYESNPNQGLIDGGIRIFELQLRSAEGKDIKINEKQERGILLNHLNDMSTTKEQRGLNVKLDVEISPGDYVTVLKENRVYLVSSDIDDHYVYKTCTLELCNQTINFKDAPPIMVLAEGESYGVKIFQGNNDFLTTVDTKVKVKAGDSPIVRKYLKPNARIMFNNNQHGIYKIGDIIVYNKGEIVAICKKDSYMVGLDDLENNICWQTSDEKVQVEKDEYEVTGKDEIKVNSIERYALNPKNDNARLVIKEDLLTKEVIEVNMVDNSTVEIKAKKPNELVEIEFYAGEEFIAMKNILTVR